MSVVVRAEPVADEAVADEAVTPVGAEASGAADVAAGLTAVSDGAGFRRPR